MTLKKKTIEKIPTYIDYYKKGMADLGQDWNSEKQQTAFFIAIIVRKINEVIDYIQEKE